MRMTRVGTDVHTWQGQIDFEDGQPLDGKTCPETSLITKSTALEIEISGRGSLSSGVLSSWHSLRFLAFVDPTRVPLYLIQGPSLDVGTKSGHTKAWLKRNLVDEEPLKSSAGNAESDLQNEPWHASGEAQSRIAILLQPINTNEPNQTTSRVSELLVYARRVATSGNPRLLTPPHSSEPEEADALLPCESGGIVFSGLLLCSHALSIPVTNPSPEHNGAQFVSLENLRLQEEQQSSKKRLNDLFDEASTRRKQARRHNGRVLSSESLAADNSPVTPQPSNFDGVRMKIQAESAAQSMRSLTAGHDRDVVVGGATSKERRVSSLEPGSRPSSRMDSAETQRLPLSRVGTSQSLQDDSTEAKNKQLVARVVMAGMRLYGLQQRRPQATTRKPSMASDNHDEYAADIRNDAEDVEYKQVYHQAYKGTLFAFVSLAAV